MWLLLAGPSSLTSLTTVSPRYLCDAFIAQSILPTFYLSTVLHGMGECVFFPDIVPTLALVIDNS